MSIGYFSPFLLAAIVMCMPMANRLVSGSTRVNRRDPEMVLRAYFAAWHRNDRAAQKSFMTAQYASAKWYAEPVKSVKLVSTKLLDEKTASPWSTVGPDSARVYRVVFDYTPRGRGVSMERGRYTWTYVLTWDTQRRSWLISSYGAG